MTEPSEPRGGFPFHHGRLALSFAGTLGDRGSLKTERVGTPQLLGAWAQAAKLTRERITPPAALYRRALLLRESIARAAAALVAGGQPATSDIAAINDAARRWAARPALEPDRLTLVAAGDPLKAALGRVAVDAIEMLSDPQERARLRTCGLDACGAIFLTPAGRRERRWCSMARCGNRAKVSAFRTRDSRPARRKGLRHT